MFTGEIFHAMVTKELRKAFGVGQSDQVLHFNGQAIEIYWLKDDMEALKKKIINMPLSHNLFSARDRNKFRRLIAELRKLIARSKKVKTKELKFIFIKSLKFWAEMYPHYRVSNFLPGPWAKDFKVLRGKVAQRIARDFQNDRQIGEGTFESCDIMMRDIFKNLLLQKGISPLYAKFLNYKEGRDLILKNKTPDLYRLETRTKEWVMAGKKFYVNVPFKKLLNRLGYFYKAPEAVREQKEISGIVAYRKGIIRGKVKLVLNYDEIKDFPAGAILVTVMTAPAYVPAMKRAKAIVTDEGGVTCHAAIVSRELKVPCVIGTKIATKVLKDGDLVEVDAEKGIVRKFK